MSNNYGFPGAVPPGVNVEQNISRALEYQASHSPQETFDWFYDHVRNNKDGHLPQDQSMDYKQIDPKYADFGNFNYGTIGRVLGIPDSVLEYGAGWAQGIADGLTNVESITRSLVIGNQADFLRTFQESSHFLGDRPLLDEMFAECIDKAAVRFCQCRT